ncbi:MAG: HNH endonuclease [Thermoplasmatales archaeon]
MKQIDEEMLELLSRKYARYGIVYDYDPGGSREPSSIPWSIAKEITLERDSYACRICGKSPIVEETTSSFSKIRLQVEVHHIIPRIAGGSDSTKNLVTLCKSCHIKTFRHEYSGIPSSEVASLDRQVEALTNSPAIERIGNKCISYGLKSFFYSNRVVQLPEPIPSKICQFQSLKRIYDEIFLRDLDLDEVIIKIENKGFCVGFIEK